MVAKEYWLFPAVAAILAAGFDLRSRRIPNQLTYSLFVVGLLVAFILGNVEAALVSVSLCVLPGVLGFLLNILGGGDVKLLAALGAWLVPEQALWLLLMTICLGGVLGAGFLLWQRLSFFLKSSQTSGSHMRAAHTPDSDSTTECSDSEGSLVKASFAYPHSQGAAAVLPLGLPICLAFWLVAAGVLP